MTSDPTPADVAGRVRAGAGPSRAAGARVVTSLILLVLVGSCTFGGGAARLPKGIPDDSQPARVVRIVDGDTAILRGLRRGVLAKEDTRVRLLEIDTPESVAPGQPVECFGPEATERLEELMPAGARVWVQPDQELEDPYERLLLYVWADDGTFVNLAMVRAGFAEAVLYEPNDRYIGHLRRAERRARADDRGMWGAC